MPGRPEEYVGYRAILDDKDTSNIAVYWQFQEHTQDETCRLFDLLETAKDIPRVKNFTEGVPSKGYGPVDLRTLPDREPTIVTNSLDSHLLYVIDGNNRTIGHYLRHGSLAGVPAFVCVHPRMLEWAYIPEYWKNRQVKPK